MTELERSLHLPLAAVLPRIQDRLLKESHYFGIKTLKNPFDLWVYQEIVFETKPDVLIEIGNFRGGSTLALAHLLDAIGHGRIIGIDIDQSNIPEIVFEHPRITLIEGDACQCYDHVISLICKDESVLVIEDSSHTFENTLDILRCYSGLVKTNHYFIVEDSICHHGLDVGPNPGPYEAIEAFARENAEFQIDSSRESFLITWNPKGYLKRIV